MWISGFSSTWSKGQGKATAWPFFLLAEAAKQPMVQRVGFLILFLGLLIGGTAFLMWIAP